MHEPPHNAERDAGGAADPLVGRRLASGYRLVERIAQGGLSDVYRAVRDDGEAAIVKVLAALYEATPLRHRFRREAELAARLGGRGAARALDAGTVDERPYVVLESVRGELLGERLRARPPTVSEAVAMGRAVLAALGALHAEGVVHRDVKPANVVLCGDGTARLLDLGAATIGGGRDPREETESAWQGTPAYAAPEQIEGGPVGARADVYAAGVMLFEMVARRRPFAGDPVAVLRAHVDEEAPRLRSVAPAASAELEAVVARALAKRPADRFADAAAMAEALAAVPEAAA